MKIDRNNLLGLEGENENLLKVEDNQKKTTCYWTSDEFQASNSPLKRILGPFPIIQ